MNNLLNKINDQYVIEKNDILDLALLYVRKNNIEQFLSDVIFTSKANVMAHYNNSTKEIVLNDDRIIKTCYKLTDRLQKIYHIQDDHYNYFLNYYYLFTLYHELMHVSQRARFEQSTNQNNIYNYLYAMCIVLHSSNIFFYKHNHDIFPMEIEANNNGYLNAYNLIKNTQLLPKEKNILYLQYLFSLSLNYKKRNKRKIISPIELLNMENEFVDINSINVLVGECNLSRLRRMTLGLFITPSEYEMMKDEKYKCLVKTL